MYDGEYWVLNIWVVFLKKCRTLIMTTFLLKFCINYLPFIEEDVSNKYVCS